VTTDLLSWRGKARALLEPFSDPPRDEETVAGYLTRAFGREVADYYVGPLYGGLYGSRPEEMYVRHSLGRALDTVGFSGSILLSALKASLAGGERPPVATFDSGMQALPRALYDAHADAVHLETPVNAVYVDGDGYVVDTDRGAHRVDEVVLTTPADVTARILAESVPDAASRLEMLTYNPMVLAYLVADCDREAAGYQVQFEEGFRTLGVTFNDHLLDRTGDDAAAADGGDPETGDEGLYTCFLGGSMAPRMVEWGEDRLLDVAVAEFERVTDCEATPLGVRRLTRGMPAYDTSWTALEGLELPDGIHLATNYVDRAGIPGRIRSARQTAATLSAGE
jgi:oxygen-dependent protoporphyrinogen oxidase